MNEPIWWLKNTNPPSIDRWATPKICATVALVTGTVDSQSRPITEEKTYTLAGDRGTSKKSAMAAARAR